jgi:ribosomal protein S18 acetylase RimI-like enzyme
VHQSLHSDVLDITGLIACYLRSLGAFCAGRQARDGDEIVGVVVCKQDVHRGKLNRGYIAMLSVRKDYRNLGIGALGFLCLRKGL